MSDSKAAVSVSEMARMIGLSRQRFHTLRKQGVFPEPDYDPEIKRPFYDEEKQAMCLDVKRRNCGINGKVIMFYSQRSQVTVPRRKKPRTKPTKQSESHAEIIDSLKGLGLSGVTSTQVEEAIQAIGGTDNKTEGEVVKAVFLHLKLKINE